MTGELDPKSQNKHVKGWQILRQQVAERSSRPWEHVRFCTNFLVGVFVFGGIGFWFEFIRFLGAPSEAGQDAMLTALITLIPALVGATALQLVFENDKNRPLQAFGILVGFLLCSIAGGMIVSKMTPGPLSFLLAAAGCICALWFWVVANAENPALHDGIDPDASLGGDASAPLQGSVQGFNT